MFTDGLVECQKDIISLNGVTAKGMKNLIDFAYSSKLFLDFGKFYWSWYVNELTFFFDCVLYSFLNSQTSQKK